MLDYLDVIESDMSVFHRVPDIYAMPGPLFFRRAPLLAAYAGALSARLEKERDRLRPVAQQVFDHSADAEREALQVKTGAGLQLQYPEMFEIEKG